MKLKKEKPLRVFATFSKGLNFLRSQNYTTGKQEASYIFGRAAKPRLSNYCGFVTEFVTDRNGGVRNG